MNTLPETVLLRCRKNLFAFIVLFILILIIYSNTFDASWHFDDENNILNNKSLHLTVLKLENIKKTFFASWKTGDNRLYRPTACLSFALNYYFGQTNVFGYHLVNLMVHFLAAFFLFLFIQNTLNLPAVKKRYGPDSYLIALLATLLWAINPIQTQAVTYIVQRMTSMAGMLYIAAMFFYLKGRTSVQLSPGIFCYVLCIVSGLLAVGSKENAIMLPVSILLFDLFLIQGISRKNVKRFFFLFLIITLSSLLLALLLKGPSIFDLQDLPSRYLNRGFTLGERLLTEPRVILFYISLLLYPMPHRLCLEHDITISTGLLTPPSTSVAILIILGILAVAIGGAKKWPLICFCIIFFFLNHLIEGTIYPLELTFEHRNYLPSLLFFVPVAILLSKGIQFFSHKKALHSLIILFVILLLIGWGHSTYARNTVWKNDGTLSFDCVEKYPDLARPHHNLGRFYLQKNLYDEAINEFLISLSKEDINNLASRNWTLYNLGSIYQTLGNDAKALWYYEQAQKYQPHFAPTHIRKGQIFLKRGLYDRAVDEFHQALKSRDHRASALTNLGRLFLQTGQIHKAIEQFESAIQVSPQDPDIMRRLGLAHRLKGRLGKAFFLFRTSLDIHPNNPFTLLELAAIYEHIEMKAKKEQSMEQFFAVFDSDAADLKKFVNAMKDRSGSESVFHSHQQQLLGFLAAALQERSAEYRAIAQDCLRQTRATN